MRLCFGFSLSYCLGLWLLFVAYWLVVGFLVHEFRVGCTCVIVLLVGFDAGLVMYVASVAVFEDFAWLVIL